MPPYRINETSEGFFELKPETGGAASQPTSEESSLATNINDLLARVRNNDRSVSASRLPDFLKGLRAISIQGLTGSTRDIQAAALRFEQAYGSNFNSPLPVGAFVVDLDSSGRIKVRPIASAKPTDAQVAFAGDLDRQERLIRAIYERALPASNRQSLPYALQRLAWAGKIGLEGANPNVSLARLAMQSVLLDALLEHGATIRDSYIRRLAVAYTSGAIMFSILCLVYMYILDRINTEHYHIVPQLLVPAPTILLLMLSIWCLCIGAWLSALRRIEPDSPEVIDSIFRETIGPSLRAFYIVGFGFLALLLLHKRAVVFAFGGSGAGSGFTTELVFHQLSASILTGAFLGLGEAALPNAVVQRSANLIAALVPR